MTEIVNTVDIDADLSEMELSLADYIRSYNPSEEDIISSREIGETQDEVLIALNQYLATEAEEDYSAFREALEFEFSQDLAEELAIS